MPVNGDCLIEPETVYRLIESNCKNPSPSKANLRSLTRLFYGLASPQALQEFRDVSQSERADLRFLAPDLGLPETLKILKQAEGLACEASNARRMSLARIRYIHRIKMKEIKEETGTGQRPNSFETSLRKNGHRRVPQPYDGGLKIYGYGRSSKVQV